MVKKCPLVMNGWATCVDLNVLALGSYDVLIGMDWLEAHRAKLDCYNNTFECLDEDGNLKVVKDIPKVISNRNISAMQLKKFYGKGCRVYTVHVLEAGDNETPRLEEFHVLHEFRNILPDEIPGLPPKSDINFTIELVQGKAPVSKTPYKVSTLENIELKM